MSAVAHPPLDGAAYVAMQEEAGWRLPVELIEGEAVVIPPSGAPAASVQGELHFALRRWQEREADTGLLLQDVFVGPSTGPVESFLAPDIAWWSADRKPPRSTGAVKGMPSLVVEVLSPATRINDLGAKRELYLDLGVEELWLVDPEPQTVRVVRPDAAEQMFAPPQTLRSDLLPGFAVDLTAVFSY